MTWGITRISMNLNLAFLRDALWLSPQRARAYRNILLGAQVLAALVIVVGSHGGLDFDNRPIGTDFIAFWTASQIALSGSPAKVYDVATHLAAQRAAFGGSSLHLEPFLYPPVFLLVCLPLALLSYGWALLVWLTLTGALMLAALGRFARDNLATVLSFPALWLNVAHGQNGFLTTALLAGGAAYLETRPVLAGVLFGGLIYKPHFLPMVLVVLLARWRLRAALAVAGSATALCGLSMAVFGIDTWRGFGAGSALARRELEEGLAGYYKMQSLFAAVRLFGGSVTAAYAAQGLLAVLAAATLAWICRRADDPRAIGAALASAALLASPYLLVYDLVLLAIPLLWVWQTALRTGFLSWEKAVLAMAFFTPMIASETAYWLHIPLTPIALLAAFGLVVRRINSLPTVSR